MIKKENIQVINNVENWQKAIEIACKPLLENKSINENYVLKIIDNIKKLGFYIVIDEYVAMPHARPEDGVNKTDVAFLKVNNGVMFGDDKIYLIFVLASYDSNEHIDILQKMMALLQDANKKQMLIKAKDVNEIGGILI